MATSGAYEIRYRIVVHHHAEYRVEKARIDSLWFVLPSAAALATFSCWREAVGLALGWSAVACSLTLSTLFLRKYQTAGLHAHVGTARIFALGALKLPLLAILAFFAARLGVSSAALFVVGALSVYFALVVGAIRCARLRE